MKLISFIIPAYNSACFIDKCLKSIFSQQMSIDLYEVIIIDDGSTDNTIDILKKYAQKYSNFIFLSQKNAGPGPARNAGLKLAQGEYIQFVDTDDYILEYDFEDLIINTCQHNNLDILALSMYQADEKGIISQAKEPNGYGTNKAGTVYTGCDYILNNNFIASPCLYVFNRKFLIDNNIFYRNIKGCEDIDHTIIVLFTAQRVMYTKTKFYVCYFTRECSLSRTPTINFELALTKAIYTTFVFLSQQKIYLTTPQLQQTISDWLLYIFKIQYNHLRILPIKDVYHILQSTQNNIKTIYRLQNSSNKSLKQKRLLQIRSHSTLLMLIYNILQKLLFKISHINFIL